MCSIDTQAQDNNASFWKHHFLKTPISCIQPGWLFVSQADGQMMGWFAISLWETIRFVKYDVQKKKMETHKYTLRKSYIPLITMPFDCKRVRSATVCQIGIKIKSLTAECLWLENPVCRSSSSNDLCTPCLIAGLGNAQCSWQLAYSDLDRNYSHSKAMNFNHLSCPLSKIGSASNCH